MRPGAAGGQSSAGQGGEAAANDMLQQTMGQLAQMQQAYQSQQAQFQELSGAYQGQQQVLDRLKGVFSPDGQGGAPDPVEAEIAETNRVLEYYIAQGFEREKQGAPIPLTIDTAVRQLQGHIRQLTDMRDMKRSNELLKQQVAALSDEGTGMDRAAGQQISSNLITAIESIYGSGDQTAPQKRAMWAAVTSLMGSELKNLRSENPKAWDRIRRSPQALGKLVNHFVEQTIPPRARELMQTHQIQSQPLTQEDLFNAFAEAKAIQDPRQREQMTTKIRQDILAARFGGRRPEYQLGELYRRQAPAGAPLSYAQAPAPEGRVPGFRFNRAG